MLEGPAAPTTAAAAARGTPGSTGGPKTRGPRLLLLSGVQSFSRAFAFSSAIGLACSTRKSTAFRIRRSWRARIATAPRQASRAASPASGPLAPPSPSGRRAARRPRLRSAPPRRSRRARFARELLRGVRLRLLDQLLPRLARCLEEVSGSRPARSSACSMRSHISSARAVTRSSGRSICASAAAASTTASRNSSSIECSCACSSLCSMSARSSSSVSNSLASEAKSSSSSGSSFSLTSLTSTSNSAGLAAQLLGVVVGRGSRPSRCASPPRSRRRAAPRSPRSAARRRSPACSRAPRRPGTALRPPCPRSRRRRSRPPRSGGRRCRPARTTSRSRSSSWSTASSGTSGSRLPTSSPCSAPSFACGVTETSIEKLSGPRRPAAAPRGRASGRRPS